jgi:hypothetical protein
MDSIRPLITGMTCFLDYYNLWRLDLSHVIMIHVSFMVIQFQVYLLFMWLSVWMI